jgi:hypothetical protein
MGPVRFRQLEEQAVEAGGAEPTKESAMRYMLMIHNDPELHPTPGSPEWDQLMADYGEFSKELVERGHTFSGDPLNDPSTATTVRVRDGETLTVDGPFAETKEWMSGYYIVDFESLDQALRCAAMIPSAKFGSVEVRPVAEM